MKKAVVERFWYHYSTKGKLESWDCYLFKPSGKPEEGVQLGQYAPKECQQCKQSSLEQWESESIYRGVMNLIEQSGQL